MARHRIGLIGLGAVAQVVHLPVLRELQKHFDVVAGCDVVEDFARAVGERYCIPATYTSVEAMLNETQPDAVAVLNSDEFHCEATVAALKAGCHVLLEKPASLVPREIEEMVAARDAARRIVMVGYMRRHAPAYLEMRETLRSVDQIQHASVRDIIGPNAYFINQVAEVIVPRELPSEITTAKAAKAASLTAEVLGDSSSTTIRAFRLLCGLASHDLSALRGLIGAPTGVVAARATQQGRFISAMLDYGAFTATYEVGMDQTGVFDAYIEVFAGNRRYRVEYDTPYIRHLPTTFRTTATDGERTVSEEGFPSYRDPYTNQWLHFAACMDGKASVMATLEDAAEDVRLAIQIAELTART